VAVRVPVTVTVGRTGNGIPLLADSVIVTSVGKERMGVKEVVILNRDLPSAKIAWGGGEEGWG
jgi:hypothetical protein